MGNYLSRDKKKDIRKSLTAGRAKYEREQIMAEYAEKVAQKQQEYAKLVREINKFQPNVNRSK